MNVLKNILFFGLLIAVLCGVYLSLSRQPEQPLPPELACQATPPTISGPPALDVTNAPAAGGTATVAPPQSPMMNEWPVARGDTAPPFPAQPSPNVPSPLAQKDVPADTTGALPPPPSDTPSPGRDPFRNPKYPAGLTNPSQPRSLSAAGSSSIAPPWADQPARPEMTNVSNPSQPPEEHARTTSIDTILQQVGLKVNEGKLADALLILSPLYDNPDVPEDKAKKITEVLDYMAAKVIYSREDLLEPRYGVRQGDTLDSIADRYKVPSLLLARINGINDPQNLSPGKELKVLKGPFIAKVSTARGEMTMMLDGRYAGRFPIKLSSDLQQATGLYRVQAKSTPAANGSAAKPQWIELGNATGKIGIEASSELRSANTANLNTLWLSEQDMDDVYGILSVGSVLIIPAVTSRTIHIAASFATVLVAYWTYALLALPLIETQAAAGKVPDTTVNVDSTSPPPIKPWEVLFPENAWELREAKVISSNDQVLLLWKTYANHADGWVDLNPLTIIFMTDDTALDPKERFRHATVMQVPGGANLHFDRPLDLNRGTGIGRLIEGRLRGEVNVRSQGKRPDHGDDLRILTHDVEITEQRITTPNVVEFWYGPNWGRGRQMEIKLLPRLGPRVANQEGPNIGGIKQIQLEHVERIHLEMGPTPAISAGAAPPRPESPLKPGGLSAQSGPVEITCQGPFCFHLVDDQVATFRDQVNVLRSHADGPSDRLMCELLSVFFARPAQAPGGAAAKGKPNAPGFDLQPSRFEAQGSPAVLTVPIDHLEARAERMRYNLIDGQVFLEDHREAVVKRDRDEIHTPSLLCVPGPQGHQKMLQLLAGGPGWLRGEMADRPGQQLEARWKERLEVRPQQQYQVISLTGGAALDFQAMHQLEAREIHFRLRETPPSVAPGGKPAAETELQPDQLFAVGNVVGNSPQFSCKAEERLDVWSKIAPQLLSGAVAAGGSGGAVPPYRFAARTMPPGSTLPVNGTYGTNALNPGQVPAVTSAPYVPSNAAPQNVAYGPQGAPASGAPQQHMEVSGRQIEAQVTLHDRQQGDLTEVTVIDRVHLQETQTAQPGDLPLVVTGDTLSAIDANSPRAKVMVLGKPAHMEGRGMALTGPSIAIDRGANRLTMDGAGTLERTLDRDLENRPLSHPSTLRVDWHKAMAFDGRIAHFQDAVKVHGETQLLRTNSMDVSLDHRINFSDSQQQPSLQQPALVETIHCGEGVDIVNQSFEAGRQVSSDHIILKDLDMNNITGEFHATGPGRVVSVRHGGAGGFNIPGGPIAGTGTGSGGVPARPAAFAPGQSPANAAMLDCLDLTFMKSITGNKNRKDMVFHGRVVAAHAPAQSWNTALLDNGDADPNHLGPPAFVIKSESLEVADMSPVGGGASGNMELQARDNVFAEGALPPNAEGKPSNFYAHCARLSYSQAKDQLIFEGDGRSLAELYKQSGEGTALSPFRAQKILYFVKTGEAIVNGFRSLEMSPPSPKSAPSPAAAH